MSKEEERERRLKQTGKWFETQKVEGKDIWLSRVLPIALGITLLFTVFFALVK